jgi:predicted NodU family carbamoyl transferase
VNTSFNTRSEPVVCTPRDALAIGSFLLEKR